MISVEELEKFHPEKYQRNDIGTSNLFEKVEEKVGNVIGERWEVQQAWDKQNNFLKAQARAQGELRSLIKQYDEMLHKNWELASEEQKMRVERIKVDTDRLKRNICPEEEEGVEIINDLNEKAGTSV